MVRKDKITSFYCFNVCDFSGLHHAKENCELNDLKRVKDQLNNSTAFYPKRLHFPSAKLTDTSDNSKPNGGWSDLRDITLCLSMSINNN